LFDFSFSQQTTRNYALTPSDVSLLLLPFFHTGSWFNHNRSNSSHREADTKNRCLHRCYRSGCCQLKRA